MVREANMKQAASEKQLKEAWGKVRPIRVCLGQPMAPVIVPEGVYNPQLARACSRSLSDLPGTGEPRSGTGRVGLRLSSPGTRLHQCSWCTTVFPRVLWIQWLLQVSFCLQSRNVGHGGRAQAGSVLSQNVRWPISKCEAGTAFLGFWGTMNT